MHQTGKSRSSRPRSGPACDSSTSPPRTCLTRSHCEATSARAAATVSSVSLKRRRTGSMSDSASDESSPCRISRRTMVRGLAGVRPGATTGRIGPAGPTKDGHAAPARSHADKPLQGRRAASAARWRGFPCRQRSRRAERTRQSTPERETPVASGHKTPRGRPERASPGGETGRVTGRARHRQHLRLALAPPCMGLVTFVPGAGAMAREATDVRGAFRSFGLYLAPLEDPAFKTGKDPADSGK